MKLSIVLAAILLTGCCTAPIIPPDREVSIDPSVLESCKEQVQPKDPLTLEGILETTSANSVLYKECKAKNDVAITLIKKFTNHKEK